MIEGGFLPPPLQETHSNNMDSLVAVLEPLDELRESSVDFYATVRSLYCQNREFDLRKGRPADTSEADDAFEAFE